MIWGMSATSYCLPKLFTSSNRIIQSQLLFFFLVITIKISTVSIVAIVIEKNNSVLINYSIAERDEAFERIISGSNAQENEIPFMVSIWRPKMKFICGGVLLSPEAVITSADCVIDKTTKKPYPVEDLKIFPNYQNQPYPGNQAIHRAFMVSEIKIHPDWEGQAPRNLALLRLNPTFSDDKLDDRLRNIIKFAPLLMTASLNYLGSVKMAGFGATSKMSKVPNSILRKIVYQILTDDDCYKSFDYNEYISGETLCARPEGGLYGGPCRGDDGGPVLLQKVGSINPWQLIGIITQGHACRVGRTHLFTLLDLDWVQEWLSHWGNEEPEQLDTSKKTSVTTTETTKPTTVETTEPTTEETTEPTTEEATEPTTVETTEPETAETMGSETEETTDLPTEIAPELSTNILIEVPSQSPTLATVENPFKDFTNSENETLPAQVIRRAYFDD